MKILDNHYVPEIGDVIKYSYSDHYRLVIGCRRDGTLYFYHLYTAYKGDSYQYINNIVRSAIDLSLNECATKEKIISIKQIPISIAFNEYKTPKEFRYKFSIDKSSVISWMLKSMLVNNLDYNNMTCEYVDILTSYRNSMQQTLLGSSDDFQKFHLYQYIKSNRIIFSLGETKGYKVFIDLKITDKRELSVEKVMKEINRVKFKNTKVFMTNDIKNLRDLGMILSETEQNEVRELVKVRGVNV